TPVFDFHDLYRGLDDEMSSYRLVDRDGDILVLRSDITLFLARQMGLNVQQDDLPVRVYYGDTILRHEDPHDLSKNEFFQIGAELIGTAGVESDAEILLLLLEAADGLGASSSVLHVGCRALLRESSESEAFARVIEKREWDAAGRLLADDGADPQRIDSVIQLYRFIGTADELRELISGSVGLRPAEHGALRHLLALTDLLSAAGHGDRIRIDLSEVGDRDYYSGIVFHLYDEGADAPVASGGRYDELIGRFGSSAPSVGFSLMLRRLQSRLPSADLPRMPDIETAGGGSFQDRVRNASLLRAQGKVVRL
ncbi:MAG: ATP phosphoribosyltransferase regulatory subunit, partial [Spirochaetia bacterium]